MKMGHGWTRIFSLGWDIITGAVYDFVVTNSILERLRRELVLSGEAMGGEPGTRPAFSRGLEVLALNGRAVSDDFGKERHAERKAFRAQISSEGALSATRDEGIRPRGAYPSLILPSRFP